MHTILGQLTCSAINAQCGPQPHTHCFAQKHPKIYWKYEFLIEEINHTAVSITPQIHIFNEQYFTKNRNIFSSFVCIMFKIPKKISCTKKLAKQKFSILTSDVWITLDSCMNEYLSSKKKQDVMFICINVQTKGAVESFRWFRFICYWKDFEITCCWSNSHLFYML